MTPPEPICELTHKASGVWGNAGDHSREKREGKDRGALEREAVNGCWGKQSGKPGACQELWCFYEEINYNNSYQDILLSCVYCKRDSWWEGMPSPRLRGHLSLISLKVSWALTQLPRLVFKINCYMLASVLIDSRLSTPCGELPIIGSNNTQGNLASSGEPGM